MIVEINFDIVFNVMSTLDVQVQQIDKHWYYVTTYIKIKLIISNYNISGSCHIHDILTPIV